MLSYPVLLPALSGLLLAQTVQATPTPSYQGYNIAWSDDFSGAAGASPSTGNWNIITGRPTTNGELETYTSSNKNLQLSGGSTVQLIPLADASTSGGWTSGRIESKYTFTPPAGAISFVEGLLRFGANPTTTKQGLWPAFWMLGQSFRAGGSWPSCGEIDAFESVDGNAQGWGHVHCNTPTGGICNEPTGLGSSTSLPDNDWHTWRVTWDLTSANWTSQTISWSMGGTYHENGETYYNITGTKLNNQAIWNSVTATPLYFILNMAVGGYWPGDPNSATLGGTGAMMEVGYVAQYIPA